MSNKKLSVTIFFGLLLIALWFAGYSSPSGLNWGFHFFGLLPGWYIIVFIVCVLLTMLYVVRSDADKRLFDLIKKNKINPFFFLGMVLALFTGVAFILRQKEPLLGDSYILIGNILNTFDGKHALELYREPLAVYYFYYVTDLFHLNAYPGIMDAFLIGELILGVGVILNMYFSMKLFVTDAVARVLAFVMVLTGAYMQLFLGYTEIYAVVLFVISLYILIVSLWMREKLSFIFVPPAFLLMVCTHYLTMLLVPSLIYLAYSEFRKNGFKKILGGSAIVFSVMFVLLIILDFNLHRFIPYVTHSPFLSMNQSSDDYQAYTMFSLYHFIDLFNVGMLTGLLPGFLLLLMILFERKTFTASFPLRFLFVSAVPVIIFFSTVKYDLGMATDWDVSAPYFFLITFFAVVLFMHEFDQSKMKIVLLCIVFSVLQSLSWISVNASEDATVKRTTMLFDGRLLSREGLSQNTFHLGGYYSSKNNIEGMLGAWNVYLNRYPSDERILKRRIGYLQENGLITSERLGSLLDRWLSTNSSNEDLKSEIIGGCLNSGNVALQTKNYDESSKLYRLALRIDPLSPKLCNNIGVSYSKNNILDSALYWYNKAIQLDSNYLHAYENIGKVYLQQENKPAAIAMYEKIITLSPESPLGYENLAKAYYQSGDKKKSTEQLILAARRGSRAAQGILQNQNVTW